MNKPDPPCKDCPYRNAKCHADCEKYRNYYVQNELYRDEQNARKKADIDLAKVRLFGARSVKRKGAKKRRKG